MVKIDLDGLVHEMRRQAALLRDENGIRAGMLAGMLATGRARLGGEPGNTIYRHGGYLSGHLLHWLVERGLLEYERFADVEFLNMLTGYTVCLADAAGQRALAKPDKPMSAHVYATLAYERKVLRPMSSADERMLFAWLLEQAGVEDTPALIAKLERLRLRRHARLGFEAPD